MSQQIKDDVHQVARAIQNEKGSLSKETSAAIERLVAGLLTDIHTIAEATKPKVNPGG